MAVLASGGMSFEFIYRELNMGDWIEYEFFFKWNSQPLVRDDILKRHSAYWNKRSPHALVANECEKDGLIPLLEKVLASGEPDYWEAIEPDIIVALYPEMYFPFLPSHLKRVWQSDASRAQEEARIQLQKERGQLPDDMFTVMVFVDAYNFAGADAYQGNGLALVMTANRSSLEAFLADLKVDRDVGQAADLG